MSISHAPPDKPETPEPETPAPESPEPDTPKSDTSHPGVSKSVPSKASSGADAGDDAPATGSATAPELERLTSTKVRRTRVPRWVRRTSGPLVLLALWQVLTATGALSADVLASPGTIARVAGDLVSDGSLTSAMGVSLQRVALGLLFGVVVGTSLALVSGLFRIGEDLVDASVQMLRTVPFVGLIPLFIIWFGIGEAPKIAIITLGVSFPLYLNVYAGIRNVDAQLIEAGQSLGLSRWGLVRHVVLPGALPGAMTGLRYSLGIAWLALVFAEQVNADSGLGFLMVQARDFLRTDVIVVCLIVYAFLGLAADFVVRTLERVLLRWRPTFTGQ
ncbi:putative aliphatic sulfonates transport permease protein SsuC [Streptomyces sp. YIM 130001]|uniref:ABC transporter permease n=1 Tax=Streptomyces sp. YIM 130001 TaxID=2259644 RepID=UPI000E654277|nr:ABC transporter permease [Streptomyces sp. YIM 130001]RII09379.1 putative aliphatic sulfonates transport permease protein SsuC [Streptomyces sp. YIM 130001]